MDIDARLINWGAVMRVRHRQGHCFSAEHRFKALNPPMTVILAEFLFGRGMCSASDVQTAYETRAAARSAPLDILDAQTIEDAWRIVPARSCKALLRMFYVKRRQPAYIAKRLAVDFDRELIMAKASISIELSKTIPDGGYFYHANRPVLCSNTSTV